MYVAGKYDLFSAFERGHDHALHGGSRAAHHQKGVFRAERVGGEFFRIADDGNGVAQIVQRFHGIYVCGNALFPQKINEFGIAPPALVPGHVKGDHAHFTEFFQRLEDRRTRLIHARLLSKYSVR